MVSSRIHANVDSAVGDLSQVMGQQRPIARDEKLINSLWEKGIVNCRRMTLDGALVSHSN